MHSLSLVGSSGYIERYAVEHAASARRKAIIPFEIQGKLVDVGKTDCHRADEDVAAERAEQGQGAPCERYGTCIPLAAVDCEFVGKAI